VDIHDLVIINMMMETSKTESLGATNSIELVIPEVWSFG
jgi:hypothetical protein